MDKNEEKIRYLEMIQDSVKRMSQNSFALKGWTIALIAGLIALSQKESSPYFFIVVYIPAAAFYFLDTYYLQLERKYRTLHNLVRCNKKQLDFDLCAPKSSKKDKTQYLQCALSKSELLFYVPTVISIGIIHFLLCRG